MNYTKIKSPPAVLILNHFDRIEVFAERGAARIHIANAPHVAGTPAAEVLAEHFLDTTLPQPFREMFSPSKLLTTELIRRWAPSDIARRDAELDVLESCDQIAGWREVFIC